MKKNLKGFLGVMGTFGLVLGLSAIAANIGDEKRRDDAKRDAEQKAYDESMAATGSLVLSRPTPRPEEGMNGFVLIANVDGCRVYRKEISVDHVYVTTSQSCKAAVR